MKLYNLNHSPYASRVRALIRQASLNVEICDPPEALGSDAFVSRFPLGKIPVLELDDTTQLPDSWVIMEYLDETVGDGALSPEASLPRAHMQLLSRYADTYLGPAGLFPLFKLVTAPGGTQGPEAAEAMAALEGELARLERLLAMLPACRERALHLGDIALVPHMDYVLLLAPMFGQEEPLQQYPLVSQWYQWVQEHPAVAETSAEMRAAVAAFFGG